MLKIYVQKIPNNFMCENIFYLIWKGFIHFDKISL